MQRNAVERRSSPIPMNHRNLLHRRACLRGIGATLALPLLETMGWAEKLNGKPAAKPPVRIGFMYMPHGVIMDQFWPTTPESFLKTPPPALESLRHADFAIQRRTPRPRAIHLAHRFPARCPQAESNQHRHLSRPDRRQLRRCHDLPALAGVGYHAADTQGASGRSQRRLLLAL